MRLPLILLLVMPVMACQSTSYYWQAAQGQWALMRHQIPLKEALEDETLTANERHNLTQTPTLLTFAHDEMHLPVGEAYQHYVALDGPYVVWNVVASPRFALSAHEWCFPIAGCTRYKGFFQREDAEAEKAKLLAEGYDVDLRGVIAYSTLGWFDDPVLSSFANLPNLHYEELLLHELAHRRLYLKGDTVFNESWATAVAQAGIERKAPNQSKAFAETRERQRVQEQAFLSRLNTCVEELEILYEQVAESGLAPTDTHPAFEERKQAILTAFREAQLKAVGPFGYRAQWVQRELNNAHLLALKDYYQWVPALREQLNRLQGDFEAFYQWSEELIDKPQDQRQAVLEALTNSTKRTTEGV